jgi:succinate dehydrogenase/fumarate reductase flavoprotein subunit
VLDTNRKPIPRLYSAGELGAVYSWHYQGGGNILECIVFGHIAGERAAAEKPWS